MNDKREEADEPRWLRLAASLRAMPDPATLARVRARVVARAAGPAWVRWLSRPIALAASAALLVASALTGSALLSAGSASAEDGASVVSTLLGDDGSYGLPLDRDASPVTAGSDSEAVTP